MTDHSVEPLLTSSHLEKCKMVQKVPVSELVSHNQASLSTNITDSFDKFCQVYEILKISEHVPENQWHPRINETPRRLTNIC